MPITATRTTTFRPGPGSDQDNDGFVDIGDILRHTLVINNTATDATNVVVNDPLNGSTLTGNVNVSPLAFNDSFTAVGNTLLEVGNATMQTGPQSSVAGNILTNDVEFLGDTYTISAFDAVSANGGTVNVITTGPDAGSFTYISNDGFTGTDTFTYTIRDDGLDGIAGNADDLVSIGTVTITVANQVWYVQAGAVGGDGTSTNPFGTVTAAGAASGANDYVYVQGAASGSITLDSAEQLIGTGTALVVGGFTLTTAGANSSVNLGGAGFTVTLGSNNTISGVDILNTGGGALTGTGFGTATISDVALDASGQALSLTTGTIAGAGFNSTDSDGGVNNVNLQSVAGNVNLGGGALSGATSNSVVINGGAGSVDYNGTVTHASNGHAIQVINKTGGTVDFDGSVTSNTGSDGVFLSTNTGATINFDGGLTINTSSSNTTGFQATTGGTVNITGAGNSITSGTGTALDLNGVTVGVNGIALNTVNTANAANGVLINTVNQAAGSTGIDIIGGTISNAGTRGVDINATSADVAIGTTISTSASGRSVEVTNSGSTVAGGSVITFSGAIDENGIGINLDNNDQNTNGATINFTGGLDIDSTTNTGFNAINGGTVNITGTNTIDTTTGTALFIANTIIGGNDLTFQRISAGTGAGSAGVGISLDNTGSLGGLHVTGTGSAGSGGVIQHKTGTDGSTTGGVGIYLNNTFDVILDRMLLHDFDNFAIRASDVNGLSFANSVINGNNGNSAGADEGAILILNSSGAILITNSQISGGFEDNLRVHYDSATPDTAVYTIQGNTFSDLQNGNNALINLRSTTTASTSSNITFNIGDPTNAALGNIFDNSANQNPAPPPDTQWFGDGILVTFEGGFQHNINIDNNTFFELFQAIDFAVGFSADVNGRIYSNDITYTEGVGAIAFGTASTSTAAMLFQMLVEDNIIGGLGNNSGSRLGSGIVADFRGAETARVTLHQNQVRDTEVNPINIISQSTTDGDTHLRITNNIIASIDDDEGGGAGVIPGINLTTNNATNGDIFLTLTGNTSTGINEEGVLLRQATANNTFQIEDLVPAAGATGPQVETFLEGLNTSTVRVRTVVSVVQYTAMNNNNTNTPAPFTPLLVTAPPPGGLDDDSDFVIDGPTAGTNVANGDLGDTSGSGSGPIVVDDGYLSQGELGLIVEAAIQRWADAGATEEQLAIMRSTTFTVAGLPGYLVGLSDVGNVTIDHNAAGFSWFIDETPDDDSEYNGDGTRLSAPAGTQAGDRLDLLTTIMHELGHQVGLGDDYDAGDRDELMYGTINPGERRLPGADDLDDAGGAPVIGSGLALTPINIGTIPAGRSVTIQWDSVVDSFGAGLVPTYNNASTITGNNPGAFSVNSNTETLGPSSAPLALDSLVLGGTVWNDNGVGVGGIRGNGVRDGTEAGVDGVSVTLFADNGTVAGVWDASDTLVGVSQLTAGGGNYSFTGLAAGDYIVRIDLDNFTAGGNVSLLTLQASSLTTPEPIDPDNNVDNDDNGARAVGDAAYSNAITLAHNTETTLDGSGQLDINNTLDFAFFAPDQEPTLTATPVNPTYAEDAAAADLYSTVSASTVEAGQTIASMTLTVSGLFDGASEILTFDGSDVALTNGNTVAGTATNGLTVNVTVAVGTATVSFSGAALTTAQLQTLVDSLAYRNTSQLPTDGNRVVTITQLVDSGSNVAPNDNVATLNIASTVNVDPVNDTPVVSVASPLAVDEQVTEAIAPAGTISDADLDLRNGGNGDYDDAVLTVSRNGGSTAQDVLTIIDGAGFVVNGANLETSPGGLVFATVSGGSGSPLVISFTSSGAPATSALVDAVLQAIQYTYTGDNPPASIQLDVSLNDGAPANGQGSTVGHPATGTGSITVNITNTPENQPPVVDLDDGAGGLGATGSFTEGGAAQPIGTSILITDPDVGDDIVSATITITDAIAGDELVVTLPLPGSIMVDGASTATNVILIGAASQADYETALGQISYRNTGDNPTADGPDTSRSITVTVNDGDVDSGPATMIMTIVGVNDDAIVTGDATGDVTEAGGVANGTAGNVDDTGDLDATDVDGPEDSWTAVSAGAASTGGYGTYELSAAGVWTYTLDDSDGDVQALNVGDTLTDTFTAVTTDGASAVVTVTINGANDAAVVTGDTTGDVTEAGGVNNGTAGDPDDSGDLDHTDVDNTDDVWQAVAAGADSVGGYGTYGVNTAGEWTYTLDDSDSAVQALNVGDTLTDTFNVLAEDGTTQVVTITINGANDNATITGDTTGDVIEAGGVANGTPGDPDDTGDLASGDLDNTADAWNAVVAGTNSTGGYGTYELTAGGVWTYTLDNNDGAVQALNVGDTLTDTFTVTSEDGTSQTVTITINGSNDAAVVTGDTTGDVIEAGGNDNGTAGDPDDTGDLDHTDVDNTHDLWLAVTAGTVSTGGYGSYGVTTAGVWSYTLDDDNAAVEALNVGDTLTDTFTVTTGDGTTQVVSITIDGRDDDPDSANDALTTDEATAITTGNLLTDDTGDGVDEDVDGPGAVQITEVNGQSGDVGVVDVLLPSGALVTVNSDGTFSYDPNGAFDVTPTLGSGASNTPATDSFTYTITGGETATVTITITGLDTNDELYGAPGFDALSGGTGNDRYFITEAADVVIEASGEGDDRVLTSVSYALLAGSEVETLSTDYNEGTDDLDLTGNDLDNLIIGNDGDNRLIDAGGHDILVGRGGNDILIGGAGFDLLDGGAGDDLFFVDSAGDIIIEALNEGNDRVFTSVSFGLTAGAHVEILSTDDDAGAGAINLTGNELANAIYGNAGANVIDGRGGIDFMFAREGDDSYFVDNASDFAYESLGDGNDRVYASTSYTLVSNSEIEILSTHHNEGTGAINLTGNEHDNVIFGNAGANVIDGKGGSDYLVGSDGSDTYAFTTNPSAGNVDTIVGFLAGGDVIALDDAVFTGLALGELDGNVFVVGSAAQDADDRIIFNDVTGALLFDADGTGGGVAIQFATLTGDQSSLSASDFQVI